MLDFWAVLVRPCMQGMPEVDRVAKEFEDQDVEFVAVNMQEDRTTIAGALERLKIQPAVALDIDGATAEKYEVSAIPQTVIIDQNGNVARIFIGADPEPRRPAPRGHRTFAHGKRPDDNNGGPFCVALRLVTFVL